MLKLNSYNLKPLSESLSEGFIAKLTTNHELPGPLRDRNILLVTEKGNFPLPNGFRGYFFLEGKVNDISAKELQNVFALPQDQEYLADGDIVKIDPKQKSLKTLYRRNSYHNSMLVTEQCNNYCLMCSQPPKDVDDSYIINELLEAIPLMNRDTKELGITGGEPTLLGDKLVEIIRTCKNYLPFTALHILSNGRLFSNLDFT